MADRIANDISTGATLAPGSRVSGGIHAQDMDGRRFDTDYYRLDLAAGDSLRIAATARPGLGEVAIRLRDDAGQPVTALAEGPRAVLRFLAPEDGPYFLAISAGGSDGWQDKTGGYRIAAREVRPLPDWSEPLAVDDLGPVNRGLTSPTNSQVAGFLGWPDGAGAKPSAAVAAALDTRDADPSATVMTLTGFGPALDSLGRVLGNAFHDVPGLDGSNLATAGMLSVRHIAGTETWSNHAWGLAVDLSFGPNLDSVGDGMIQTGLARLVKYFNREKWVAGAGYTREDSMHFEVSAELLDTWFGPRPGIVATGARGADRLSGSGGDDLLSGYAGPDRLSGLPGRDRIAGGAGDDRIAGGAGRDRLLGQNGDDRLAGGPGADRFVFRVARDDGYDRIVDFSPGADRIVLRGGPGSFDALSLRPVGGDTVLDLSPELRVRLLDVTPDALGPEAFTFL